MPGTTGPRLISHVAEEERPTLDPRLQLTAGALHELRARKAKLERLRAQLRRGELGPSDMPAVYAEMRDGFSLYAQALVTLPTARMQAQAFITELPKELRAIRREYIEISRDDPDAGKLEAVDARRGYFRAEMVDGGWNSLQARPDDCVQAAISTVLQCAQSEVPDLKLGDLIAAGRDPEEIGRVIGRKMGAWMEKNAVSIRAHSDLNLPKSSRRWIGVVDAESDGNSHCVIVQGSQIVADSAWLLPPRKDEALSWHSLDDVSLGLTLE